MGLLKKGEGKKEEREEGRERNKRGRNEGKEGKKKPKILVKGVKKAEGGNDRSKPDSKHRPCYG